MMMYDSPLDLQEQCLFYISENLDKLCTVKVSHGEESISFFQDVFFHATLSESFLRTLIKKGLLDDRTSSLFNPESTCLQNVKLRNSEVSLTSLRMLKMHRVRDLEATGMRHVTVNDLIGCLGEWSINNIWSLNVAHCEFLRTLGNNVVVPLSKLRSLHCLNISNTQFTTHNLEIIVEDLPSLENLDISGTLVDDITPLRKCKRRLKSLVIYNLRSLHQSEETVSVLLDLCELRHLDFSDDIKSTLFTQLQTKELSVEKLMTNIQYMPNLVSLDVSGNEAVSPELVQHILQAKPELKFLGLAMTSMSSVECLWDKEHEDFLPDLVVSGEFKEAQLVESIRRYFDRPSYIQRSLFHLFEMTHNFENERPDIIDVILAPMEYHPKQLGVQMAATACLYNLTKGDIGVKIHPLQLSRVVHLTMEAMHNFPKHPQLQKNALLTLCSDRILQDVTFDRFRCAKYVMNCLCEFDHASMNRMAVAICSILAAKIPTDKTSQLGSKCENMRKLLSIVEVKMGQQVVDITLKFALSALWNLTDESPSTCETFLKLGGLTLFIRVLEAYSSKEDNLRVQVETKVLGLINNLAEVEGLRQVLIKDEMLYLVQGLLQSRQIDVSYFAAGIVSHIVSDTSCSWGQVTIRKEDLRDTLRETVMSWGQPDGEMVAYRSFTPFFPLLDVSQHAEVQLWAVWAIHHVCAKNGPRYCPMLVNDEGHHRLSSLVNSAQTTPAIRQYAEKILNLIQEEMPGAIN